MKKRCGFGWLAVLLGLALVGSGAARADGPSYDLSPETLENVARVLWMKDVDPAAFPQDVAWDLAAWKNSESAFGQRMRYYLNYMKDNPDSYTPSYADVFDTFLQYSDSLTPHQSYALSTSVGVESSRGHQELSPDKVFSFPQDDAPQFEYQTGWHFFVGSVFSDTGQEYGVEYMFWHYSLLPEDLASQLGLTPLENQVVEMHLAVTPAGGKMYRAKPYVVAGTTGLVDFGEEPFNYRLGNNYMRALQGDGTFPLELKAWGLDETTDDTVEMEIDLTLNQAKPYMLNGDEGFAPCCGGVGTLYYSVPNLPIDPAKSVIKLNGETIHLDHGKLWYDHQWGSSPSPVNPRDESLRAMQNLSPREPDGWEWIAAMFDDNTEIALSVPKRNKFKEFYMQTGDGPPPDMTAEANGLYMDENGEYRKITGSITVTDWLKSTVSHGQYEATNTWYPNFVEVTLDTGDLPADKQRFNLRPIVDSGQVGWFAPGWQYSEGAVYLEDPAGNDLGRGFLELTGWADYRGQVLDLAGIPRTQANMEFLDLRDPSDELVAESLYYLAQPENQKKLQEALAKCRGM
ncbi:MAG: ATP-binding protein [Deltaproteobacteria bacterium]|nr:ATP-binding protein [Deltaproteobacteria bacterium]